jgi:hypothetical protein
MVGVQLINKSHTTLFTFFPQMGGEGGQKEWQGMQWL